MCNGNNPENCHFNQALLRKHLLDCFNNNKIVPFPKQKFESLPRPHRLRYTVDLFCVCRMPEDWDTVMILCDICEKWFHCSCVGVQEDELDTIGAWICEKCKITHR